MTSFPPPSPNPSDGPYGPGSPDGHGQPDQYGQPEQYGQPDDYGQSGGYGQPADEQGRPADSGGFGPQWEAGAAYRSPAPEPGPTLPQGAPAQGGGPPPVAAPGTDLAADLGAGLTFAGQAMLRNPVSFLVSGLIYPALITVFAFAGMWASIALIGARADQLADSNGAAVGLILLSIGLSFVVGLLAMLISCLWQSGAARSGVVVLEGGRPSIGQAMIGPMRVILTALLSGAIIVVGTLLLYIPGLIAAVLLFYAIPAAARGASPIEALKESFQLATKNLGTTIVAYLVLAVISTVVGMLVITLVAIIPFLILFQLGMYERISGRAVAEPARA